MIVPKKSPGVPAHQGLKVSGFYIGDVVGADRFQNGMAAWTIHHIVQLPLPVECAADLTAIHLHDLASCPFKVHSRSSMEHLLQYVMILKFNPGVIKKVNLSLFVNSRPHFAHSIIHPPLLLNL